MSFTISLLNQNAAQLPASATAAARRPATIPAFAVLVSDMWNIIFEYAQPPRGIAAIILPDLKLERFLDRPILIKLQQDLKGSSAFINVIAVALETNNSKIFSEQITALRELAARCQIIESGTSTIDATTMLATVSANANRVKIDLINILKTIDVTILEGILLPTENSCFLLNIFFVLSHRKIPWDSNELSSSVLKEMLNGDEIDSAVQWLDAMPYGIDRLERYNEVAQHVIEKMTKEPEISHRQIERALEIIDSPDALTIDKRVTHLGKLVDGLLKAQHPFVWELLIPKSTPEVTAAQTAAANENLATVKKLLASGDITGAFEQAKRVVTLTDPISGVLLFPEQCYELFRLLIELRPHQLAMLNPAGISSATATIEVDTKSASATAATSTASASAAIAVSSSAEQAESDAKMLEKPLMDLYEFIVKCLPDDDRKNDLLEVAAFNMFFDSLDPIFQIAYKEELSKKPFRILQLAKKLSQSNELGLALEVASHIRSPEALWGFIVEMENHVLQPEQSRILLNLAQRLPNYLKFLLIERNKEKPNPLYQTIEKEFDLKSFREEAERDFLLVISTERFSMYLTDLITKKSLTPVDRNRILLYYTKMDHADRAKFVPSKNDLKLKHQGRNMFDKVKNLFLSGMDGNERLKWTVAINYLGMQVKERTAWEASLKDDEAVFEGFPVFMLEELRKNVVNSNPKLATKLQEMIVKKGGKEALAKADEEYETLISAIERNPLLKQGEATKTRASDIFIVNYINDRLAQVSYEQSHQTGLPSNYKLDTLTLLMRSGFMVKKRNK